MKWFIPSWNGDLRLEADEKDPGLTILSIVKPTEHELLVVNAIGKAFEAMGWLAEPWQTFTKKRFQREQRFVVNAPLEKTGPVATSLMRPGKAVLTAIRFKGGQVETVSGDAPNAPEALAELAEQAAAAPPDKPAEAAVTVKRPTPSCPSCIAGSIQPATEALLAFLSEEEHDEWSRERSITVQGGLSGNRYRLSHRHSRFAQQCKRMCFDLDDHLVVHFHDWTVPPEEEVLAAKLILEHREHWLRNEATMLGARMGTLKFKNPFGGFLDGVPDAKFTSQIGVYAESAALGYSIGKALMDALKA
jgi:hypothetical protein